jgi:predicted hydrocarbon binding protein
MEPAKTPAHAPANTKGIGFANVRAFVEERYGSGSWNKVLGELVAADRRELEGIVPVGWYSLALYARLIRAVDQVFGYGDLSLVVQIGRFEAERDLTTIHRIFLRLASPAFMLEKQADYWRRFHDTGQWVVQRDAERRVTAYLDDWGYVDPALCREVVGYVTRSFELIGAKNVRMEHSQCRGRGDPRCVFLGRWGSEEQASVGSTPEPRATPPAPAASGPIPVTSREARGADAAPAAKSASPKRRANS